jgi:uncharacterized membrane protein
MAAVSACGGDGGAPAASGARLLAAVTAGSTAGSADGTAGHGGADTYAIVNLAPAIGYRSRINTRGQAAYEYVGLNDTVHVAFFDGDRIRDIVPTSPGTILGDMNEKSEVAAYGVFPDAPVPAGIRPFRWSPAAGTTLLPLRAPDGNNFPLAISKRGTIAGMSAIGPNEGDYRAARWTTANAVEELVTAPGYGYSFAFDINDHDVSVGYANDAAGVGHSFIWNAAGSPTDLGGLGATGSYALMNNNRGDVAGLLDLSLPSVEFFLWSQAEGVVRLGTGATAYELNEVGELVGAIGLPDGLTTHAFIFSRARGRVDLQPAALTSSLANHLNDGGTVVGWASGGTPGGFIPRAWRWSRDGASVDLNTRVRKVPDGLVLSEALRVSPTGDIIANSNAGLVLLRRGGGTDAPVLGPIQVPGEVRPTQPFELVLPFLDRNAAETHTATIDWGDGAGPQAATVTESGGQGTARASHTYAAAGDYNIVASVTDAAGRTTTQYRRVTLYPYCVPGITGDTSLAGAAGGSGAQAQQTLVLRLAAPLVAACGNTRPFTFALAGRLSFKGDKLERVNRSGNTVRLEGSGKLGGKTGYRFVLDATDGNHGGATGPDRLALRILRTDPATGRAQVVLDYGTVSTKSQGQAQALAAGAREGILPNTALRLVE